jgi:hypothetical protein
VTAEDLLASGRPERAGWARVPAGPARRWLRWGALAAAVAVTLVLAGPPVPVSTVRGVGTPPPVPGVACRPVPPGDLTAPRLAAPPGLTVDPLVSVCAGLHRTTFTDHRGGGVSLLIFGPGALDPAPVRGDRQVRVGAHTGYLGAHADSLTTDPRVTGFEVATLAWEYAPGAWALAQEQPRQPGGTVGAPLPRPDPGKFLPTALAIAAAVRPELPGVQLRVPVRLGWLPDGVALTSVTGVRAGAARAGGTSTLEFGSADAAAAGCGKDGCLRRLNVRTGHRVHKFPIDSYLGKVLQVGDTRGLLTYDDDEDGRHQPSVQIFRGDWEVTVSSDAGATPVPIAELTRIAAAVTFPTGTDPATWFPLAAALPD